MDVQKALQQAVCRAVEDGKKADAEQDAFGTYIYAGKKQKLEEILSWWEAGTGPEALLEKLKAEHRRLKELEAQEAEHPTFDWASEHYWECIYMGEGYGCKEAMQILEECIGR